MPSVPAPLGMFATRCFVFRSITDTEPELHEAAQAASRRAHLLRAEQKIAELLFVFLLRAGADVGEELRELEERKASHKAVMHERGRQT